MAIVVLLSIIAIFSGTIFDTLDSIVYFPDAIWNYFHITIKDSQIITFATIAFLLTPYKYIHTKILLFFCVLFKMSILVVNVFAFDRALPSYFVLFLSLLYFYVVLRSSFIYRIRESKPKPGEAFYILLPVSSFWGLLQAIFIPWHPARYETRMTSDGNYVWSVHEGEFKKNLVENTNLDKLQGVIVSLGRPLRDTEYAILDGKVGKRAIRGVHDCRDLLVAGKI